LRRDYNRLLAQERVVVYLTEIRVSESSIFVMVEPGEDPLEVGIRGLVAIIF
jgi:hypothetical protein